MPQRARPVAKGKRLDGALPKVQAGRADDLLMWIGYASYPTLAAFTAETSKIGISKRVSHIPRRLHPGETRLYLAYDYGARGNGVILGMCRIDRVEAVKPFGADLPAGDLPEWVTIVDPDTVLRGNQFRDEGLFLCSDRLELFDHPRKWSRPRFRSFRWVSQKEMERLPRIESTDVEPEAESVYKSPWTTEERQVLLARAITLGPYQACKEHARETGRTFEGCMYQFKKYRVRLGT